MKSGFWAEDLGFCLGFRGLVVEGSGFKFGWSRSFVVLEPLEGSGLSVGFTVSGLGPHFQLSAAKP